MSIDRLHDNIDYDTSMKEGKLLIADDNRGILNALQILLQKDFETVKDNSGPEPADV